MPAHHPGADLGLRERKKRATRAALQRAALELVATRGLEGVTIEDITGRVGVSPRTFFNYFATKEESLIDADPGRVQRFSAALRARPAGEAPLASMRAVLLHDAERIDAERDLWRLRFDVGAKHPEVFHAATSASAAVDAALAAVIADRTGTEVHRDPLPRLTTGISSAARRTALHLWAQGKFTRTYPEVLSECFDDLSTLIAPGS